MNKTGRNTPLTFKYNAHFARHGWLRLTPAYSIKLVNQILEELPKRPSCVLEPFSGTGTTELVCAEQGINAIACDINPFLVWLARVKTSIYSQEILHQFELSAVSITTNINDYLPSPPPCIHNINRWWGDEQITYLSKLKTAILGIGDSCVQDLLKIAFCRLLIEISNAAFNHVSTSFKDAEHSNFSYKNGNDLFLQICRMILSSAKMQPLVTPTILHQDSTKIPPQCKDVFDTVITSPPYPNRISYIRELRPYMYWLDYLHSSTDSGILDWDTIGGTWGSATSKLATWKPSSDFLPQKLLFLADKISSAANKSAPLMASYVLKYFQDIGTHMQSIYENMQEGGTVHYIVGNSCFYGNLVPSDGFYIELLSLMGFTNATSQIIRKRNCNKSLYEYKISAVKPHCSSI